MASADIRVAPKPGDDTEPMIRLLACFTCKLVEEIPDFNGYPEDDIALQMIVERHQGHNGQLAKMPVKYAAVPDLKRSIVKQIFDKAGLGGLAVTDPTFYDTRNQFAEDAMTCFGQHNRPQGQCPDFRSERKRLIPKTAAERKDVGLDSPARSGPKVYLCDYCPVKLFNEFRHNEETMFKGK